MLDATNVNERQNEVHFGCEDFYESWKEEFEVDLAWRKRRVIELAVKRVFEIEGQDIMAYTRRDPHLVFARQVAMYLAHTSCHMSMTEIGSLYARDRKTVAYACALVEDRRDDPMFDRALDLLHWAVPYMAMRPFTFLRDQQSNNG